MTHPNKYNKSIKKSAKKLTESNLSKKKIMLVLWWMKKIKK